MKMESCVLNVLLLSGPYRFHTDFRRELLTYIHSDTQSIITVLFRFFPHLFEDSD